MNNFLLTKEEIEYRNRAYTEPRDFFVINTLLLMSHYNKENYYKLIIEDIKNIIDICTEIYDYFKIKMKATVICQSLPASYLFIKDEEKIFPILAFDIDRKNLEKDDRLKRYKDQPLIISLYYYDYFRDIVRLTGHCREIDIDRMLLRKNVE